MDGVREIGEGGSERSREGATERWERREGGSSG